jgi:hypothetical protein
VRFVPRLKGEGHPPKAGAEEQCKNKTAGRFYPAVFIRDLNSINALPRACAA